MKVLSIGNSFSQDAHRYLHQIAKHNGDDLKLANLYIGGCSLRTHYINMLDDKPSYLFEFNGQNTGLFVSIKQALISDDWDVVTLQQASRFSVSYDSFSPYIEELANYVRKFCPHAKILIHQTWAYQDGSQNLQNLQCFENAKQMLSAIVDNYEKASKLINADGIIPCGEAMMKALDLGIEKIHRDSLHASLGAGRYLLALCFYKKLFNKDITNDNFNDLDEPLSETERKVVINAVNSVFATAKKDKYIFKGLSGLLNNLKNWYIFLPTFFVGFIFSTYF